MRNAIVLIVCFCFVSCKTNPEDKYKSIIDDLNLYVSNLNNEYGDFEITKLSNSTFQFNYHGNEILKEQLYNSSKLLMDKCNILQITRTVDSSCTNILFNIGNDISEKVYLVYFDSICLRTNFEECNGISLKELEARGKSEVTPYIKQISNKWYILFLNSTF